jgi:ATP-dependent Lhr-like helicase
MCFQLGNQFWRILRISSAKVMVAPAPGSTPTMPFWIAEAPGRSDELSRAVSSLREDSEKRMTQGLEGFVEWMEEESGLGGDAATRLYEYLREGMLVLGTMPTRRRSSSSVFLMRRGTATLFCIRRTERASIAPGAWRFANDSAASSILNCRQLPQTMRCCFH